MRANINNIDLIFNFSQKLCGWKKQDFLFETNRVSTLLENIGFISKNLGL